MGGSDDASNIVRLTSREHFICHLLLTKMTSGQNLYKMKVAFNALTYLRSRWRGADVRVTSHEFASQRKGLVFSEEHKRKLSEAAKRQFSDPIQRAKASEAARNRPAVTEETKNKMKESSKNRILTDALRDKFRTAADVWLGRNHSEEAKKKISAARSGNPVGKSKIVTCPHCGKTGPARGMGRHFDRCKFKS